MFRLGRFGRNVLSNSGANALQSALQLGLICLLFEWLGDEDYAAYLMAGYVVGLLEIASDYGARLWAVREFSINSDSSYVLRQSYILKCFYTVAAAICLISIPFSTLTPAMLGLCILIGFSQPSTDPFLWRLRGAERLDIEAVIVLVSRIAIVISMASLAWFGCDLVALLTIWLVGNCLRVACAAIVLRKTTGDRRTKGAQHREPRSRPSVFKLVSEVFPLGTALVLTCIFQRLSLYLVESNADVATFKVYGTAFKFVNTSGAIATAVFVSSFAALSRAIEAGNTHEIHRVIGRMLKLVTLFFVPVCLLGIWLIEPLSQFIPNQNVGQVATVLVLLMPGLYVSCVNMGLKYTLNAYKLNWYDVVAVMLGVVALAGVTLLAAEKTNWWFAGAFGWFTGESVLLLARLALLRSQEKHQGVPIAVISVSAVTLAMSVWVQI